MCRYIYWGHPKAEIICQILFLIQAELAAQCLARQGEQTAQTGPAQHLHLTVEPLGAKVSC